MSTRVEEIVLETRLLQVEVYARRVHFGDLTPVEQRVLGCLIEKRWTTPEQYPLSLNALRLACNQSTNRDPVTHYDEHTVREAAQRLSKYGLARLASGHNSRAIKYRHLAEEGLGLDREQLAVLGVLLLRGPQTPGELKQRSERLAPMPTLADVERVLDELIRRGYVVRLERRPGQKEERYDQLLGGVGGVGGERGERRVGDARGERGVGDERGVSGVGEVGGGRGVDDEPTAAPVAVGAPAAVAVPSPPTPTPLRAAPPSAPAPSAAPAEDVADLQARVAALEDDLAQLRAQLSDLLS